MIDGKSGWHEIVHPPVSGEQSSPSSTNVGLGSLSDRLTSSPTMSINKRAASGYAFVSVEKKRSLDTSDDVNTKSTSSSQSSRSGSQPSAQNASETIREGIFCRIE